MRGLGKVLLLHDNATVHDFPDDAENIEVRLLPKNTTSMYQPLDLGVMEACKIRYRSDLAIFLATTDHAALAQAADKAGIPARQRGLMEGTERPTLADAAIRMTREWRRSPETTHVKAWVKSTLIPKERFGDGDAERDDDATALEEDVVEEEAVSNFNSEVPDFAAEDREGYELYIRGDNEPVGADEFDCDPEPEASAARPSALPFQETMSMLMRIETCSDLCEKLSDKDWERFRSFKAAVARTRHGLRGAGPRRSLSSTSRQRNSKQSSQSSQSSQ